VPALPRVYVERRRLLARLDRAAEVPLTLVSAPAGSGKTVLAAAWVAKRAPGVSTAWVTFEEGNVQPAAFWTQVQEALTRQGVVLPAVRHDSAGSHSRMLTELAAALAARAQPVTLVLDGYELATVEESNDIDFLLRHSDRRLRVMILTRVDPVLPLHRYRLDDLVAEVRIADLAFTEEETSRWLQLSGISLSAASIGALTRRTKGWAAGLRFATMLLQRSESPDEAVSQLAGDTGNIAEYLMAEVLQKQTDDVQALLLRTSVVDVLQPGLIEELAGRAAARSAARTLAALAGGNVLVEALPDHPGWYRYHPFLRDLLRAELAHQSRGRFVRLHKKAADWYAREGRLGPAVGMAAAIGAWSDVSAYVVDSLSIGEVLLGHDPAGLDHDLRKMPSGVTDPAASVVRAALALADRDPDRCAEELGRAAETAVPVSVHDRAVELAADIVETVRSSLIDDPQTVALADLAQQELTAQEREKLDAHPELTALVQASKGRALLREGEIAQAREAMMTAAAVQAPGCEALTVSCLGHLALVDSHRGELRQAFDWATQARSLAAQTGLTADGRPPAPEIALALVSTERYDLRTGREHLRAAMRSYAMGDDPVLQAWSAIVRARLLCARGEADEAIALIEEAGANSHGDIGWLAEPLLLEAAMLWVVQGRPDRAMTMLDQLGDRHEAARSLVIGHAHLQCDDWSGVEKAVSVIVAQGNAAPLTALVGGRLLEAVYELHRGHTGRARIALDRALRLGAPEEMRRPFREAPTVVRQLLESDAELIDRNAWLGAVAGPHRELHAPRKPPPERGAGAADHEQFIEPLTAKETEVLGHLSELLSTEEIATAMFVSVNTVRTHIRSILRKLAVSRRNEAVRRARDLSLISR